VDALPLPLFVTLEKRRQLHQDGRLSKGVVVLEPVPGTELRVRTLPVEGRERPIVPTFHFGPLWLQTQRFDLWGWVVEPIAEDEPEVPDGWRERLAEVRREATDPTILAQPLGWRATPPPRVRPPPGKQFIVGSSLDGVLAAMFEAEPKYAGP
jgi:hypothetical protein